MQRVTLVHGGPVCWFVRSILKQGAMTFAPWVFYGRSRFDPSRVDSLALLAHELKHVLQYNERGHARFLAQYFIDKARNGFKYNENLPLEKEAYDVQRDVESKLTID